MDEDITRRIVYGIISLALTSLAAWLAVKITNMILGEPEKNELAG